MDIITDNMGGIVPELALEAIKNGAVLHPTDKDYKFYLDLPDKQHCKGYFDNWNIQQRQELVALYNEQKLTFAYPGYFYVLPFFMKKVD